MTGGLSLAAVIACWVVGGLMLGVAYFATLRRTADLFAIGQGRSMPVALTLARLVGATLFLATAARFGALPLLSAFLGFLVARGLALRGSRRVA